MTRLYWPIVIILYGAAIAAIVSAFPAGAQTAPQCDVPENVAPRLLQQFGQTPRVVLRAPQGYVVVFASHETQTWTLVAYGPARACFITSGTGVAVEAPGVDG